MPRRQFECCEHFWSKSVPDDNPKSKCWKCEEMREAIPKEEERVLRQFECCKHSWGERVSRSEDSPSSKCSKCRNMRTATPIGKEFGACKFKCKCGNRFTVICKMSDTAECYKCDEHVGPYAYDPPRRIKRKSSQNKHSCDKCEDDGCPNLYHLKELLRSQ